MHVLVALNGFKGSASAVQATRWVVEGLRVALPNLIEVHERPICDGGAGFCETITQARGGRIERGLKALDAAHRPLGDAKIGWVDEGSESLTAVIEAADTVGLARLSDPAKYGVMERSSRGLGKVLAHASRGGAKRVIIGCGDSAVQDCGVGLLEALGSTFFDRSHKPIKNVCARDLSRIDRVEYARPDGFPTVELACNLSSVLEGPAATVRTYAAQKGASEQEIVELERGTQNIATVYARAFGRDVSRDCGSGANGGVGAALMAALGAIPRYSFHIVSEAIGLDDHLKQAAVVVVGEGKLDKGTVRGKAPGATALLAATHGVPAVAIAGSVEPQTFGRLAAANIVAVQTLSHPGQRMEDYVHPDNVRTLLREAGVRLAPTVHMLCHSRRKPNDSV